MKAIQVFSTGGPEQLQLADVPVPAAGPGQVLIKIAFIGVNYIDTYFRTGLYKADPPISIGMEASGTVEAVAPDVRGLAPGDRVAYCLARGSYAEYSVVPAWQVVKVPEGVGFEAAAAALLLGGPAAAQEVKGEEHVLPNGMKLLLVYRPDEPQLTVRAVVAGCLLGGVMSIANLYIGMKVGWYDARAEQSMWGKIEQAYCWFWTQLPMDRQLDPRALRVTIPAGEHEWTLSNITPGLDVDEVVLTTDFSWIPEGTVDYF